MTERTLDLRRIGVVKVLRVVGAIDMDRYVWMISIS